MPAFRYRGESVHKSIDPSWRFFAPIFPAQLYSNKTVDYPARSRAGRLIAIALTVIASAVTTFAQPVILEQPSDQLNIPLQSPASFRVVAQGKGKVRYQWRQNGVPLNLPGAQGSSLTIS